MERSAAEARLAESVERRPAKTLDFDTLQRMPLEALLYYVLVGPGAKLA